MNFEQVKQQEQANMMHTYGRFPVALVKGKGVRAWDTEGKEYIDFTSGIGVNALGWCDEGWVKAVSHQAGELQHISNLYYNPVQTQLAEELCKASGLSKVFFGNSGAEANECAIKLARKWGMEQSPEKNRVITLQNSFHGRTLATVAATGQPKYQAPYKPLIEKFVHVERNDIEALRAAVNQNTAGVMLELIQGESGVHPLTQEFVDEAARLCRENDMALIVDEVQTGIGRTGKLFAYEHYGIEPDIFTMAKGLGGGVPIGAFCAKEKFASAFHPGDHGTTFGGNPLSTRAGLVVLDELLNGGVLENAKESGEYLMSELKALAEESGAISQVRGMGLMCGVEFSEPVAKEIGQKLTEKNILVGVVGDRVLRIVPPLIVQKSDIDILIKSIKEVL